MAKNVVKNLRWDGVIGHFKRLHVNRKYKDRLFRFLFKEQPDRLELYLSDAYTEGRGSGCLECTATMFNINRGHNQELMEKCRRLREYSEFIAEVNDNLAKGYNLNRAITTAMNNCIERGVLADVLLANRAEVMGMILTEYDEKKHMKAIRKEGYEDGLEAGRLEGLEAGRLEGLEAGRLEGLEAGRFEGLETGRIAGLEALIRKKLAKGKPLEIIAEEVEEDLETVKSMVQNLK